MYLTHGKNQCLQQCKNNETSLHLLDWVSVVATAMGKEIALKEGILSFIVSFGVVIMQSSKIDHDAFNDTLNKLSNLWIMEIHARSDVLECTQVLLSIQ